MVSVEMLRLIISYCLFQDSSEKNPFCNIPALLTKKFAEILFLSIKSNKTSAESVLLRSKAMYLQSILFSEEIFSAFCLSNDSLRATSIKLYFWLANTLANSSPIPSDAPVIIA